MSLVLGLGLEHSCPWPREGLSSERLSLALASEFFCVLDLGLGLKPCVLDPTSGSIDYQNCLDNVELKINQNNLELEKKVDKDNFEEVVDELREQVKQLKIDAVMKDSYSKRLNVLIHGLTEAPAKPGKEVEPIH